MQPLGEKTDNTTISSPPVVPNTIPWAFVTASLGSALIPGKTDQQEGLLEIGARDI